MPIKGASPLLTFLALSPCLVFLSTIRCQHHARSPNSRGNRRPCCCPPQLRYCLHCFCLRSKQRRLHTGEPWNLWMCACFVCVCVLCMCVCIHMFIIFFSCFTVMHNTCKYASEPFPFWQTQTITFCGEHIGIRHEINLGPPCFWPFKHDPAQQTPDLPPSRPRGS